MSYKEYIEYIFNMIKIIWKKGDAFVIVQNGYLYCVDDDISILNQIKLNIPLEFNLSTTYSIIKDYMSSDNCNMLEFKFYEYNIIYNRILSVQNTFNNSNNIISCENIHIDDEYGKYFFLKSSDSSYNIIKDNVIIPIFYGIVPLSKGDVLDLQLSKINDYYSIIKYTVIKKNKDIIEIYFNILNLM